MPFQSSETTLATSSVFSVPPNTAIPNHSTHSSNDPYHFGFNQLPPGFSHSSSNLTAANNPASGTIQGRQWNDLNRNGTQDANEPGLSGWTIYLDQNRNGQLDGGEQFTLTGANGSYTFTNLQPGTYTIAAVQQFGWARTSPNQAAPSTLIPVMNRQDLIFDSKRNLLYMTTDDGKLERYNVDTRTLLAPIRVGNNLRGADITDNGNTLYIAERQRGATQNFIRKVNLNTNTVTNLTYNFAAYDDIPSDIAIAKNGTAIIRSTGQWQNFVQLDTTTDAITVREGGASVTGGQKIVRGSDRALFFTTQDNISSGPLLTYNPATNTFSAERRTNAFLDNHIAAVNRNSSRIALEWGTGISILDQNLNVVENLANVDGGLAFDPIRDILYAANSTTDQVIAFDTNTWKELYHLNIGEDIPSGSYGDNSTPFGNGTMTVSNDGKYLFLSTSAGARMLDLIPPGSQTVSLSRSQVAANINFGSQQIPPPTSAISGTLWDDLNGNSVKDWNEAGIVGRKIYLDQNQNGQFDTGEQLTTTDASGSYSFTVLTAGTYTVAEIPQVGWVSTSPLSQSTLIPISDRRDLIFDSQRNLLYLTTSDGEVERYDVNTRALLAPWRVGISLNGGDTTTDNSALYIAENEQGATQGIIRKVNLNTGAVTNLTTPDSDWDTNPSDVTIGSNGVGLIRRRGQWQDMLQLNLSTDTISPQSISGSLYGGNLIARSGDRSLMLIQGADGLFTYNSVTNSFSEQKPANANSLFAINRNGSLIAVEVGSDISILDSNLNGIENLSNVDGGLAFDPTRDILYAASTATNQIVAFNTNTWQELYRLNIGENIGTADSYNDPSLPFSNGMMTVSNDGKYLFLSTAMGVRMFDLNVSAPGSSSRSQTVTLPAGQSVTGVNFANKQIPALSINDVTLTEGDNGSKNAVFTVMLSVPAPQAVTVNYATADGTAIAGTDYRAANGLLTFAPGETTKAVTVAIAGDLLIEPNKAFTINLSNPSAGVPLIDAQGVGTILNDDPKLTVTNATVSEGNRGTKNLVFSVNLSNPSTQAVSVNYATANGTASSGSDYTAINGTLTFAPGQKVKTIAVPIIGDAVFEANETLFVNLSSAIGAAISDSQAVGTITNDDPRPPVLGITDATVIEGDANNSFAAFTVILSSASRQPVTVDYITTNGTATAGTDYTATSGTVLFNSGETVKTILVPIAGDTLAESNETFFVYLSNANNTLIGDIQAVGTVQNDDIADSTETLTETFDVELV